MSEQWRSLNVSVLLFLLYIRASPTLLPSSQAKQTEEMNGLQTSNMKKALWPKRGLKDLGVKVMGMIYIKNHWQWPLASFFSSLPPSLLSNSLL